MSEPQDAANESVEGWTSTAYGCSAGRRPEPNMLRTAPSPVGGRHGEHAHERGHHAPPRQSAATVTGDERDALCAGPGGHERRQGLSTLVANGGWHIVSRVVGALPWSELQRAHHGQCHGTRRAHDHPRARGPVGSPVLHATTMT